MNAAEHLDALLVVEHDHLDAVLGEPVVAADEVARLADHHPADPELADQPAAVPARRQRRRHRRAPVAALPAGVAEGVGLAVDRRVAELHPAVVAAAEQRAVGGEERAADRDPSLGQADPGLGDGDRASLIVIAMSQIGE